MNTLAAAFREVLGLFVEDGAFAVAILGVAALAGVTVYLIPAIPALAGAILLFGCLCVLLLSVARAARP